MWRAKVYSKTPLETRNDVALHRKVWPMKNWAKHADHDHTMKELLSTGSPVKRSWEFYHELKCLFHKRAEKSTFAETIEQVNVEQASSMNKRAIITQSSCDDFWLEDKHTLIWDKCTDQLSIRLERVVRKEQADKVDVLHVEWSILIPREDLCKGTCESSKEIKQDPEADESTRNSDAVPEAEPSFMKSEDGWDFVERATPTPGSELSSWTMDGFDDRSIKRRRSFISGTEESCDHYSKESKRLHLTDSIVPATRSNAPDISTPAGTTATEVLTLNFKPEP